MERGWVGFAWREREVQKKRGRAQENRTHASLCLFTSAVWCRGGSARRRIQNKTKKGDTPILFATQKLLLSSLSCLHRPGLHPARRGRQVLGPQLGGDVIDGGVQLGDLVGEVLLKRAER